MYETELLFKDFIHSHYIFLVDCSTNSVNIYLKTVRLKIFLWKVEFSGCCWPRQTILRAPVPLEGMERGHAQPG